MEKYTIIIIEDHKLISEAWQVALNEHPQFDVVGTFDSGEEAIAQAEHLKPDMALVDITLPGMNGIQVTRQLLALLPGIRVVCASMHNQVAYARQVIRTGAFGYVTKNSAMHELYTAIEEAAAGQVYICEEIKNLISSQLLDGGLESIPQLSERELQIIDLLKEGHTSKEISKQLFISQKTVEVHRHNILRKLNLHNVAALVDYVNRHPNLCYS